MSWHADEEFKYRSSYSCLKQANALELTIFRYFKVLYLENLIALLKV